MFNELWTGCFAEVCLNIYTNCDESVPHYIVAEPNSDYKIRVMCVYEVHDKYNGK